MQQHWIWLATRSGLAGEPRRKLLELFPDAEEIYRLSSDELSQVPGITPKIRAELENKDLSQAEKIQAECLKKGIEILCLDDAAYPGRLKNIFDPPVVLYYRGTLPEFDDLPVIAVVGTRNPGCYGQEVAYRLGYEISRCGGTVVSGLALGIDGEAMHGALKGNGTVIGVLGCGADRVYPARNRWLFEETLHNGCILTEYPPGTPPLSWHFPQRNRIISGLSCGVTVVEAPEKSGALITARQALDEGRDVFVVPGNVDMTSFVGSNRLLRAGAIAVSTGWDILCEYEHRFPGKIQRAECRPEQRKPAAVAQKPRMPEPEEAKVSPKSVDKTDSLGYSDNLELFDGLNETQISIVSALMKGDCCADDLVVETGLPSFRLMAELTLLEIRGIVKPLPGKRLSLKKREPSNK